MKQTIINLVDECKQFFKYIYNYPRYRAMVRLLNNKDKYKAYMDAVRKYNETHNHTRKIDNV